MYRDASFSNIELTLISLKNQNDSIKMTALKHNNMKTTFQLLAIIFILISCDKNDDVVNDVQNPDGFTHNQIFYETVNAYIEADGDDDNGDNIPDNYAFFFTNGRMFDNDANVNGSTGDYLFSMNTTEWVFLLIQTAENSNLDSLPPQTGETYIVHSNNSVIVHDGQIDGLTPPYLNGGTEFGMGNENIGTFHFPGAVAPTITINQLNIDALAPENNFLDAEYSFMNQNGETITGHYKGSLGLILD
jgi:hypothetical protein